MGGVGMCMLGGSLQRPKEVNRFPGVGATYGYKPIFLDTGNQAQLLFKSNAFLTIETFLRPTVSFFISQIWSLSWQLMGKDIVLRTTLDILNIPMPKHTGQCNIEEESVRWWGEH